MNKMNLLERERINELPKEILNKINKKHLLKRYTMLFVSLLISSILFNLLIMPTNIVFGGINGISIILKNLYNFSPSVVIFILSLIFLLLSFIYLGVERTSGTIISAFLSLNAIEVISCFAAKLFPLPLTPKINEFPFCNVFLSIKIIFLEIIFFP